MIIDLVRQKAYSQSGSPTVRAEIDIGLLCLTFLGGHEKEHGQFRILKVYINQEDNVFSGGIRGK